MNAILAILLAHCLNCDRVILEDLAQYLSVYEKPRTLIASIENKNWRLEITNGETRTVLNGSRFEIKEMVVYFNPVASVQVKFNRACEYKPDYCVTSPEDVLIHELIHVRESDRMGAQFIYNYSHEQKVINIEQEFYRSMTLTDKRARVTR